MEELLKYWPIILTIGGSIANIVIVFFKINQHGAAITKDIALINNTIEKNIGLRITDLENGHIDTNKNVGELSNRVNVIDKQVYAHLQIHKP